MKRCLVLLVVLSGCSLASPHEYAARDWIERQYQGDQISFLSFSGPVKLGPDVKSEADSMLLEEHPNERDRAARIAYVSVSVANQSHLMRVKYRVQIEGGAAELHDEIMFFDESVPVSVQDATSEAFKIWLKDEQIDVH
jgi:hypothetical protein